MVLLFIHLPPVATFNRTLSGLRRLAAELPAALADPELLQRAREAEAGGGTHRRPLFSLGAMGTFMHFAKRCQDFNFLPTNGFSELNQ